MAATKPWTDGEITTDEDALLTPAVLHQPADELGPRAQKTIARIIDATRHVFLTQGYSGTTIDEIARVAEVSRASFYTYLPSKREVLLTMGAHAASESLKAIERLALEGTTRAGMTQWVGDYFDLLDLHGSFAFAWTQAAQQDEEIRTAGMKRHIRSCRQFGKILAASAGESVDDPSILGLVASSTLERSWNYSRLYADTIDRADVIDQISHTLWSIARQPSHELDTAR
jgi:AcrR family transcriptional regulator